MHYHRYKKGLDWLKKSEIRKKIVISVNEPKTQILCHDYRLIDYVLRPAQEYFTYMETSPLPVKGCKS